MKEQLDQENAKIDEQLRQKHKEMVKKKREALAKRVQEHNEQLSGAQIKEIQDKYEAELAALDKAIQIEKMYQLNKMRKAILERRIAKDKKKKDAEKAKKVEQVTNNTMMKIQSTKLEKKMSKITTGGLNLTAEQKEDLLKKLLREWAEKVEESRRDGSIDIWEENSQTYYEKSELARAQKEKDEAVQRGIEEQMTKVLGKG